MQTDTPSELFVHPTSAISPNASVHAIIPSALKQTKHVDTGIEEKESGQHFIEKSIHEQDETKDFSTFSKNLERQVSELPPLMSISSSAVPTDENPVRNTQKGESDFIFYKCRFCGLTYNYLTTLRAHERVHNIDEVCYFSE